jgi:hypothetical protein
LAGHRRKLSAILTRHDADEADQDYAAVLPSVPYTVGVEAMQVGSRFLSSQSPSHLKALVSNCSEFRHFLNNEPDAQTGFLREQSLIGMAAARFILGQTKTGMC